MPKKNKILAEYERVETSCRIRATDQFTPYETRLRSLTVDVILAEEDQRRRIAQGLHDQVGHALALAKLKILTLSSSEKSTGKQTAIIEICGYLDEAISATRALTFDLSSPVLHEVGLAAALEALGEQLEGQTDLKFHFRSDSVKERIAKEIEIIVYRTVEELVLNVVKHADARNFYVSMRSMQDTVRVSVGDDGVGLPAQDKESLPEPHGNFGLFSIRARIEQLGGWFDIGARLEGGTRAVFVVPILFNDSGTRLSST